LLSINVEAASSVSSAQVETIGSAVQKALIYYPSIQKAQATERGAEYALKQARGEFLPSVNLNYATGRQIFNGPTVVTPAGGTQTILHRVERGIALSQPIFTGFSSYYLMKQRHGELDTASFQVLGEKENIALQAAQAYLQVVRANQLVELGQQNVKDHQHTLDSIKIQYRGGYSPKANVDLANARLALAYSLLSTLQGDRQNAITTYLQIIGHLPPKLIYPSAPRYCQLCDLDTIKKDAVESNPLLKAAIAKVKAAYFAVASAKGAFYPQVSADVSENYNNNIDGVVGPVRDQKFLLSMKYNFFDGGMDYAKMKQAVANHAAAEHDMEQTRLSVLHDVEQAWNNLQVAEKQVNQYAEYVKSTQATVKGYEAQFKIGEQSLFNVLSMKDELFQARQDYVTSKYNTLLYRYQVLAVSGFLSTVLTLN